MIMGLIEADRGMISLDGQNITDLPMYLRAQAWCWVLTSRAINIQQVSLLRKILKLSFSLTENDKSKWDDNV